ncbi:MAG: hypothetical protein CVT63_04085 [Candidatus Anoxymicrobium japonicum]|uniref:DUF304 domain-containing protein n=1 Tax=Candidatus Anoxymicrobium japonicum TaxID=2013648 RepID=A0A2N3G646_9ACTN|nr:MAG: hypothetical protein CVT63_04085 [Candidatus Anoxymicrobium japonicum]
MKYRESMLSTDEMVVFDVHHHLFVLWKPVVLLCGFLATWIAILFPTGADAWIVFGGLLVILALSFYLASRVLIWSHANLVLTDGRLIYQTGVISRRSREIPLSKINDVSFCQMVLGRLLGMGDLVVESAGESGPFSYRNVPGPEKLKMQVLEQIRRQHGGEDEPSMQQRVARAVEKHQPTSEINPLPPERLPLYSEIVDQIERLDAMREQGVLTPEEFQRTKEALLEKLSGDDKN